MAIQQDLLALMADGQLHSGSELADRLGVTRTAVWKHVRQLEESGLSVTASAGKGYQLDAPLELLDEQRIGADIDAAVTDRLGSLDVLWQTASTSDYLLAAELPAVGSTHVCLAEYQTGGRGRRGRAWLAPVGYGLCLSVGRYFQASPASLSCLGLAVGTGVLRALRQCGAQAAALKWPNDVVLDGRKLAGILIDVRGEAGGPLYAVAGIGINYRVNAAMAAGIAESGGVAPAALVDCGAANVAGRNALAAATISNVCMALEEFEANGFDAFADEWRNADYLFGREVSVLGDAATITGVAQGIAADGRLCVKSGDTLHHMLTGDVSVRAVD